MKETIRSTAVVLDLINPVSGEITTVQGTSIEQSKYYTVSKITSRINSMDVFTVMSQVCKSSKDIEIFNILVELHNSENKIVITNITALAKECGVGRNKLTLLLKRLEEEGFLYKFSAGVYLINGFMYVGKRVNSNQLRENAQKEWNKMNSQS